MAVAAAALTILIQPAFAQSRLFSVRADKPGVTIDQALVNGTALTVAGRGGGLTFFRIDNPSGQIDCHQHVTFVASTGERQETDVDLCTQNWQVSVHLASSRQMVVESSPPPAAPSPPPAAGAEQTPDAGQPAAADAAQAGSAAGGQPAAAPAAAAEPPAAPAAGAAPGPAEGVIAGSTQTVTITTDDPAASIEEVFLDKEPVTIQSQQGNSVEIAVGGGPGQIPCQRDLGLKLSDGRTMAREVNICDHNWSVLVMLGGGGAPAAAANAAPPPAAPPATPAPPAPPAPPPVASAAPAAPTSPAPASGQGEAWSFTPGADAVTVAYGVPQSGTGDLTASCRPGGRDITVEILRPMPGNGQVGESLPVTLGVGVLTRTYRALASTTGNAAAGPHPAFKTTPADALWQGLIHERVLIVQVGQAQPFPIPLRGSGEAIKPFLAACAGSPPPAVVAGGQPPPPNAGVSPPPPPAAGGPPPPPPPAAVAGGPGAGLPYDCSDGTRLKVQWDSRQRTALVIESGSRPTLLYRVPAVRPGAARYTAGPAFLIGYEETLRFSRFGEPARVCRPRLPYPVASAPPPPPRQY
jgi:hypothetical protein